MVTAVFPPGGPTYTNQQTLTIIDQGAAHYNVPSDLAKAIAWVESALNPNAAGDWVDANGHSVAPYTPGSHPGSIGLFQLNEHGYASDLLPAVSINPWINTDRALKHLSETTNPGSLSEWAYQSQHPADHDLYVHLIDQALRSKPWENLTNNDPSNPPPAHDPGNLWPFDPISLPALPPLPIWGQPDPGSGGGGGFAAYPDLITTDPIEIANIPGLGKVTLNISPIINWALRLGLTVAGVGLVVYGVVVVSKPVTEKVQQAAATVAREAA